MKRRIRAKVATKLMIKLLICLFIVDRLFSGGHIAPWCLACRVMGLNGALQKVPSSTLR